MEISPTVTGPNSPDLQAPSNREKDVAEAARQFEALLLRQFVQEAFKPMFGEATAGGAGKDVCQYFMTSALADSLSRSESFGFSNLIQIQLAGPGQESPETPSTPIPSSDDRS